MRPDELIDFADIIVVGGGSAGCAMAARLAEGGQKTLLIEAGKSDVDLRCYVPALTVAVVNNPKYDRGIPCDPDETLGGREYFWPAARRLGGGSSINGMIFVRGHRRDYDGWAEKGATGWAYEDVLPYFRRMEDNSRGADEYRGEGGPISVSDNRVSYPIVDAFVGAAQAAGIPRNPDHNGENPGEGTDFSQATQGGGLRCSSARGYLRGKLDLTNLRVLTETDVQKVVIRDGRATGVFINYRDKELQLNARSGVVVSAGTLNSPRLLMLSGIGPKAHLKQFGIECLVDSAEVGANLQEHVGTHMIYATRTPSINSDGRGLKAIWQGLDFLLRRRGVITTSMCHAQAFVKSTSAEPIPDVQVSMTAFAFEFNEVGRAELLKRPAISVTVCLARPEGRGRIRLGSVDPGAPPRVSHRLLESEGDIERIARGIEIAREIMGQDQIAEMVESELTPGPEVKAEVLRQYIPDAVVPLYHPVGSCRMGSDPSSVVDPDLAVRGVQGLWIADASVMPSLPIGNTNATAIMIGDKGADHILRQVQA